MRRRWFTYEWLPKKIKTVTRHKCYQIYSQIMPKNFSTLNRSMTWNKYIPTPPQITPRPPSLVKKHVFSLYWYFDIFVPRWSLSVKMASYRLPLYPGRHFRRKGGGSNQCWINMSQRWEGRGEGGTTAATVDQTQSGKWPSTAVGFSLQTWLLLVVLFGGRELHGHEQTSRGVDTEDVHQDDNINWQERWNSIPVYHGCRDWWLHSGFLHGTNWIHRSLDKVQCEAVTAFTIREQRETGKMRTGARGASMMRLFAPGPTVFNSL